MSEAEIGVRIGAVDLATPVLRALARPFQEHIVRDILGSLPTVLHNRLSDGTREPLAAAFVATMEELGYRIVRDPSEPIGREPSEESRP